MADVKKREAKKVSASVRASVSFPPNLYRTLESIARQKKVSVAWVVRDAAERYAEEQLPLFPSDGDWYERRR